jgi:hypothetical protein
MNEDTHYLIVSGGHAAYMSGTPECVERTAKYYRGLKENGVKRFQSVRIYRDYKSYLEAIGKEQEEYFKSRKWRTM